MAKRTTKRTAGTASLMDRVQITTVLLQAEAKRRGLDRYLVDGGAASVRPGVGIGFVSCDLRYSFLPLHGVAFELETLVTDDDHGWPLVPAATAKQFVDWMEWLRPRAADVAATRRAITAATTEVIAEAAEEGIELELLGVDLAPVHVFLQPAARGDYQPIFYVRLVMDHDDAGTATRDVYTIDADDAEEFAAYLRHRTLPELRADRAARETDHARLAA